MNAFNNINLAGACLLMSTESAKKFGIPEHRWIYPLGGAGTRDAYSCKSLRHVGFMPFPNNYCQSGNVQISTLVRLSQDLWMLRYLYQTLQSIRSTCLTCTRKTIAFGLIEGN
jgi:hypothetical protein